MARPHDETLARLRELPAFADWDAHELERLARLGDRLEFRAGTCLTRAGVPARQAFLLLSGAAVSIGPGGVGQLGPGALVCELEPLTGAPASATVRAEGALTVLVLTATSVLRFHRLRTAALGERKA